MYGINYSERESTPGDDDKTSNASGGTAPTPHSPRPATPTSSTPHGGVSSPFRTTSASGEVRSSEPTTPLRTDTLTPIRGTAGSPATTPPNRFPGAYLMAPGHARSPLGGSATLGPTEPRSPVVPAATSPSPQPRSAQPSPSHGPVTPNPDTPTSTIFPGSLSLPLPLLTSSPHAPQQQLSLAAFGVTSPVVAQPSSSLVLGGSMPLSAGSVSHFSASATEARNAPPSPPTPTLAHSSANGVHLPNMWLSNKWGRAQHSEGMYGGFGANAARREPVVSSVDLQVRPRWRERDNSGSGPGPGTAASVGAGGGTSGTGGTGTGPGSGSGSSSTSAATNGGFIYGSSATSLHMNGLNGFGPVNGSTHFSHGLNHGLTSPRGNVSVVGAASGGLGGDRSPSPAAPLFNSSTGAPASANGGGGPATKDYSPFSYDYDRYREERRDAREVSPLTREPMRVPGPSSSAPNQPDTALNYNHFGSPQPLTQPQSQQHVGNHFANPFSGGSEYARLTPFPPRLTPTATLRPQHQPYGETGYAPAYEHGQTSYASWPSMHPPPSNLLVPEMNGMGPLSGVGSIRPHEDIHYAWTSTPPPLAGSSVEMEGRSHSVSGPVPKPKPQRRFPCPDCNEAFTRRNDLVRHRRKHTGEKPFACPVCGQAFARKDKLLMHIQRQEQCTARAPPRAPRGRARRDLSNSAN